MITIKNILIILIILGTIISLRAQERIPREFFRDPEIDVSRDRSLDDYYVQPFWVEFKNGEVKIKSDRVFTAHGIIPGRLDPDNLKDALIEYFTAYLKGNRDKLEQIYIGKMPVYPDPLPIGKAGAILIRSMSPLGLSKKVRCVIKVLLYDGNVANCHDDVLEWSLDDNKVWKVRSLYYQSD